MELSQMLCRLCLVWGRLVGIVGPVGPVGPGPTGLKARMLILLIMHQRPDILTAHNAFEITYNIHVKHVYGQIVLLTHRSCG